MTPEEAGQWVADHRDKLRPETTWRCPAGCSKVIAHTYRDTDGQLLLWFTGWQWGRPGDRVKMPAVAYLLAASSGQKTRHGVFGGKCPRCRATTLFAVENGAVIDVQWHSSGISARLVD